MVEEMLIKVIIDFFGIKGRFSIFRLLILLIIFSILFVTLIDFVSINDSSTLNSIVSNQNIQNELRKNELHFRENLISKKDNFISNINFDLIDSISNKQIDNKLIKRYLLINQIKKDKNKIEFITPIPIQGINTNNLGLLIEFTNLQTTYEVDFDRLENIIENSKNKILTNEILKYGNYLNVKHSVENKIKKTYVIGLGFLIIILFVILFYINRIGIKTKNNELESIAKNLEKEKENLKSAKEILEDNIIKDSEVKFLKKLINDIEKNIDSYKIDNILESVLFTEVTKSEKKSLELYNRSTLMLILGLIVAIAGIVIFYLSLPVFKNDIDPKNYLALTIRPSLVLIFIQTISFYLLRQYRSLINDYKYFHNEYAKNSRIFSIYQLMQNDEINENERKFIELLMSVENQEIKPEVKSDSDTLTIIETLKGLVDKLK